MKMNEAAKQAILVQDACNLSGVVHSFNQILSDCLWPEARLWKEGTDWVNTHPISILFANKIASLTGQYTADSHVFSHAWRLVEALKEE